MPRVFAVGGPVIGLSIFLIPTSKW